MGCGLSLPRAPAPTLARAPPATSIDADLLALPPQTSRGVHADYRVSNTLLGKGSFGAVWLGHNRVTGEAVAIKLLPRTLKAASLAREYRVLSTLLAPHPAVVEFIAGYSTRSEVQLVTALCSGGELFDRILEQGPLPEGVAAIGIAQIASGLSWLHERGIIHRDIKPENIMISSTEAPELWQIGDFGLAELCLPGQRLSKSCGTWAYAAPEMQSHDYSHGFDLWSLGVLAYVVLVGLHPFDPEGRSPPHDIRARARAGAFSFDAPECRDMSLAARAFISALIVVDEKKRLSAAEALQHEWLAPPASAAPRLRRGAPIPRAGATDSAVPCADAATRRSEAVETSVAWRRARPGGRSF